MYDLEKTSLYNDLKEKTLNCQDYFLETECNDVSPEKQFEVIYFIL